MNVLLPYDTASGFENCFSGFIVYQVSSHFHSALLTIVFCKIVIVIFAKPIHLFASLANINFLSIAYYLRYWKVCPVQVSISFVWVHEWFVIWNYVFHDVFTFEMVL